MVQPISSTPSILKVAIAVPLNCLFDYLAHDRQKIEPGVRVLVPFGKSKKVGFVVESGVSSDIKMDRLKSILEILDEKSLISKVDFQLLQWASCYYHYPLGGVFSAAFPVMLRKGKEASLPKEKHYQLSAKGGLLNPEQLKKTPKQKELFELLIAEKSLSIPALNQWNKNWRSAAKALIDKELLTIELKTKKKKLNFSESEKPLQANQQQQESIDLLISRLGIFSVSLIEGVTGSGKTEVYMQVIQEVLNQGQQVLVLLPEINLTPQLEARFKQRFAVPLSITHSKLTELQRHCAWLEMQQGQSTILLGTRSALFTPMKNLGLIILDEEHDSSFKQQEGFRFSARDLAIVRGKLLDIPVVLGTATPSLESLYNVEKKRYQLLRLSERAGDAIPPDYILLDIRNKQLIDGISESLIVHIKKTLAKKEQVLLFLNRRGFAPVIICHSCAWVGRCQHCDTSLVIHYSEQILRCHHCGYQSSLPKQCPACKTGKLSPLGIGTERVEKSLRELFPDQHIIRLDRDTTQRKGALESHLEQIIQGKANIILGTQMLAKGHHFPNVTLVAILDVDSGLFSIDFHATEKLAQLIVQVAGRAGRAEKPGKVILQTRQPDHPLLSILLKEGYQAFAQTALIERQQAGLPPYGFQAMLRVYANNPEIPFIYLRKICEVIQTLESYGTLILGPVVAPMAKRAGNYHFQLLLQNAERKKLQSLLDQLMPHLYNVKEANKVRWSLDVDPVDLY